MDEKLKKLNDIANWGLEEWKKRAYADFPIWQGISSHLPKKWFADYTQAVADFTERRVLKEIQIWIDEQGFGRFTTSTLREYVDQRLAALKEVSRG